MSVRPTHKSVGLTWEGFPWNLTVGNYIKICYENKNYVKIEQNYRALYIPEDLPFLIANGEQIHQKNIFLHTEYKRVCQKNAYTF